MQRNERMQRNESLCYLIESEEEENVNYIQKYVAKEYKNLTVRFKVT